MTLGQTRALMDAAERAAKQRRAGDALSLRMAQADGKAWRKYMQELLKHGS